MCYFGACVCSKKGKVYMTEGNNTIIWFTTINCQILFFVGSLVHNKLTLAQLPTILYLTFSYDIDIEM